MEAYPYHKTNVRGRVVSTHLLIAERVLGKSLPRGAEVHHFNGDPRDNRRANLIICQDRAYHFLIHMRTRAKQACGNPLFRKCVHCKTWDDPQRMFVHSNNRHSPCFTHRSCHART